MKVAFAPYGQVLLIGVAWGGAAAHPAFKKVRRAPYELIVSCICVETISAISSKRESPFAKPFDTR